ncbi:MAG: hypothetical protein HFI62_00390 [Lachnospiraceae bacterium]|nr:hypothetical protein [Lachnospiraceae bacterium]
MYKIKIRKMGNIERFINMVKNSRGNIYLELPNQMLCDLKQNEEALQMLYMINPREFWLELFLTDQQDSHEFINYMVGAGA